MTLPCTITWSGPGTGDWNVPGNWTPNRVPAVTDDVCISSSSTIALPATAVTIQSLTLGQATLSGTSATSDMTITGSFAWTSGTLNGQGRTTVRGGMTLSGSGNKALQNNRRLENAATATWTGFGDILLSSGAVLANLQGATFHAQSAGFISQVGGGTPRFENAGLFLRSQNSNETGIETAFENTSTGTVDVQTGDFFISGSFTNGGTFTVSAGVTVAFESGTHTMAAGSTVGGAGNISFVVGTTTLAGTYALAGTTRISGGSVLVNADASTVSAVLSGGTLGGTATFTVSNSMNWTGGQMTGTGTTRIAATATLTMSGDLERALVGRTVRNAGTATWQGSGWLRAEGGAQFLNEGTFNANADGSFIGLGTPAPLFLNTGVFRKGGGTTSIRFDVGIVFQNDGQVESTSGTLAVSTGSATGTFSAIASATLVFRDGQYNLNKGSDVGGEGTVTFNGASVTVLGDFEAPDETLINSGHVTFSGPNPRVRSGRFLSGLVDGDSDLTVIPNRVFTWDGGTMAGAGKTIVAPGATFAISGGFAKLLDGRTLQNEGTINWSSFLSAQNGALWDNLASSLVEAGNAGMGFGGDGATPSFQNAGYFRKVDTAATQFEENVTVTNSGAFEILPGRLTILGTFTNFADQALAGGVYYLVGKLQFVGADVRTNDADVTLSGADSGIINQGGGDGLANFGANHVRFVLESGHTIQVGAFDNAGELNVGEECTFTATGRFTWTAGLMYGPGALALGGGWDLNAEAELTLSGLQVSLGGTSTWTAGLLLAEDGAQITVRAGAAWNIPIDANAYHTIGDEVRVVNEGTVRKTGGEGTTEFGAGIRFMNAAGGTLQVDVGILALSGGLANFDPADGSLTDGTFALSGRLVVPGAAVVTNRANLTLNGTGAAFIDELGQSAFRTLAAHAAGRQLVLDNGAGLATGAETFTNSGTLTVRGGSSLTAVSLVLAGGTATLDGSTLNAAVVVQGGTFNAQGTINGSLELRGGQLNIGGSSTGTLQVNGNYTQTGGILQIQIRSLEDYDQLRVSGIATLSDTATLQVRMIGAYQPDPDDAFRILEAEAGLDGMFETLDSTQADFFANYDGAGLTLVAQ